MVSELIYLSIRSDLSIVVLIDLLIFAGPALSGDANFQAGQSYEITFVEVQTRASSTAAEGSSSPGLLVNPSATIAEAHQNNRIAFTFRTNDQVDFERERNAGAPDQQAPSDRGPKHVLRGTSGPIGKWFAITPSPFPNAKLRIAADGERIDAEYHVSNFTQELHITVAGKSCDAKIVYRLDLGETAYITSLHALNNFRLTSLRADNIKCSIKTATFF